MISTTLMIYFAGMAFAIYSNLYTWKTQYLYVKRHNKPERNLLAINYANALLLLTFILKTLTVFYGGSRLEAASDVSLLFAVVFLMMLAVFLKNTLYKNLRMVA